MSGTTLGGPGVTSVVGVYSGDAVCSTSTSSLSQTVTPDPAAVPTVGEWTLWALMGLMMIAGAGFLIRRTRRIS